MLHDDNDGIADDPADTPDVPLLNWRRDRHALLVIAGIVAILATPLIVLTIVRAFHHH